MILMTRTLGFKVQQIVMAKDIQASGPMKQVFWDSHDNIKCFILTIEKV